MPMLHDEAYRSQVMTRVAALRRDSQRRWGRMSVDQMLWHVNGAMAAALGQIQVPPQKVPLPRPVMKFLVLNLPWPKGAPTLPMFVASGGYQFDSERARCLQLIDQLAARRLDGDWPDNPVFGSVTGPYVSRLQAKHLDHHLKQFGV